MIHHHHHHAVRISTLLSLPSFFSLPPFCCDSMALIFFNLLLLPPIGLALAFAYCHLFGGPLSHHYLYVSGVDRECITPLPTVEDEAKDKSSSSSSSFSSSPSLSSSSGRSSNLRAKFRPALHSLRLFVLGANESTLCMYIFRTSQSVVWRWYKRMMRQVSETGELERMIMEAQITMVPYVMGGGEGGRRERRSGW